jgi:hypothetical protein
MMAQVIRLHGVHRAEHSDAQYQHHAVGREPWEAKRVELHVVRLPQAG